SFPSSALFPYTTLFRSLFLSFEHYSLSMPRLKVLRFPDFHLKNIDIAFYFVVFVFEHFPLGYHWKPESLSSRLKTVRRLLYLIVQYLNQANLIQQLLFLSFCEARIRQRFDQSWYI